MLQKEKGFEKAANLLREIQQSGIPKYLNAINLGEIIYITKREYGELKKIEALASITRLNFNILPIPNTLSECRGRWCAEFREGVGVRIKMLDSSTPNTNP
jgi:predicted nucleic acid-binding protein